MLHVYYIYGIECVYLLLWTLNCIIQWWYNKHKVEKPIEIISVVDNTSKAAVGNSIKHSSLKYW